jgi:Arc/MetJ-type ribon-helix-helix transcriptional regulator
MSTIKTERVELRLDSQVFEKIDEWRAKEADLPNRSEAIRRLVQKGLTASDRQAFTSAKLQIMLAAKQPNSARYLSDAFIFAFAHDVYPAFNDEQELWAEPFEPCFKIGKEMIVSLATYLDDLSLRNQTITFYQLEKAYKSKDWDRTKLVVACRYMFLNKMFADMWDGLLTDHEHPIEANIITKELDRGDIFIA